MPTLQSKSSQRWRPISVMRVDPSRKDGVLAGHVGCEFILPMPATDLSFPKPLTTASQELSTWLPWEKLRGNFYGGKRLTSVHTNIIWVISSISGSRNGWRKG